MKIWNKFKGKTSVEVVDRPATEKEQMEMKKIVSSPWPADRDEELNAIFGRHQFGDEGIPNDRWERSFLRKMDLPYPMLLAWDRNVVVRAIYVNEAIRKSLAECLSKIKDVYGLDGIKKNGLDLFGGCYCFRKRVGGNRLSVHAWAAAIDINPDANEYGTEGNMPDEVVQIFKSEGWRWGGNFKTPDPMHFEATR